MGSPRPRPTLQWVSRPTLQWVNTRSTKTKKHLEVSYPLHHRITRCQDVPCHLGINALSIHQHVHNSDTFIVKQLSITCVLAAMILLYYYCTVLILLFISVCTGRLQALLPNVVWHERSLSTGSFVSCKLFDWSVIPKSLERSTISTTQKHGSCWLTRSNHRIWRSWISPCIGL